MDKDTEVIVKTVRNAPKKAPRESSAPQVLGIVFLMMVLFSVVTEATTYDRATSRRLYGRVPAEQYRYSEPVNNLSYDGTYSDAFYADKFAGDQYGSYSDDYFYNPRER